MPVVDAALLPWRGELCEPATTPLLLATRAAESVHTMPGAFVAHRIPLPPRTLRSQGSTNSNPTKQRAPNSLGHCDKRLSTLANPFSHRAGYIAGLLNPPLNKYAKLENASA
jgi:hypothetical protein